MCQALYQTLGDEEVGNGVCVLQSSVTSCVTLAKLLKHSETRLPHLKSGDNYISLKMLLL